ncbi:glycosyltransferase family 4 protein [Methylosarcina fibrata]|uniref:glycosyltransferase family 4 protein n=1 Tax=Methylosarcina fibrata TaxID=105972 RepID=UPI0012FA9A5C|nr:glycosyltransferase family 4 protein [Methylosarcina fibrata]
MSIRATDCHAGRKLTIVMVAACPFPANHGSPASIREMSEALVRQGHTVHILTYPIRQDIPVEGVAIHRVRAPFLKSNEIKVGPAWEKFIYDPLMVLKLVGLIRKHKVDVIHAHNYEGALIGWLGKLLTGRPMLYNAVNSMADELPTYNFIKPRALAVFLGKLLDVLVPRTGDYVTMVSDSLKEFLLDKGVAAARLKVVPAGVNLDMFAHGNGAKVRAKHGIGSKPLVMYTGTLDQFQRLDYLLKAMQRTLQECPDAMLMIACNILHKGHQQEYLALAQELGIEKRLVFAYPVALEDLPDYLAAADVTVVPRPECPGHPVKLLNYMAAGKAIVSFEGGGKGLHHMFNAYLAPDHDHDSLGAGIAFLLQRKDLRDILGAQAKITLQGNFDWNTLAKGIEIIYHIMLEEKGAAGREQELARYLRSTYEIQYVDRRHSDQKVKDSGRSGGDRRKVQKRIDFLEQRKVAFSNSEPLQKVTQKPDKSKEEAA